MISIIIPVLGSCSELRENIDCLQAEYDRALFEVIVVGAETVPLPHGTAEGGQVRAIAARRGRASQMNAGAAIASGEALLFLHVDTRLPRNGLHLIQHALTGGRYVAGAFDLSIRSRRLQVLYALIASGASLRSRLTRVPYGDQALFMPRTYFKAIGGFADIPIMEDVELMRRIKRRGDKIVILRRRVVTSARRWEREGIIYGTLRNLTLVVLYRLGVSPKRLARFYAAD